MIAKFTVNNKTYSVTKVSLFIVNYERELKMETNIRKIEKTTNFAKRMKKVQEEIEVILRKA